VAAILACQCKVILKTAGAMILTPSPKRSDWRVRAGLAGICIEDINRPADAYARAFAE
jgi:hypothetical protein